MRQPSGVRSAKHCRDVACNVYTQCLRAVSIPPTLPLKLPGSGPTCRPREGRKQHDWHCGQAAQAANVRLDEPDHLAHHTISQAQGRHA